MHKPDAKPNDVEREAADLLYEAAQTGMAVAPVRNLIGEKDLEAAYAVQEVNDVFDVRVAGLGSVTAAFAKE